MCGRHPYSLFSVEPPTDVIVPIETMELRIGQKKTEPYTLGSRYPNCSDTETHFSDSLSEQILSELFGF